MNWDAYCKILAELGVSSIHVKRLSPNDNSKNQVYLGRSKGIIPLIPKSEFELVQEGGKNPRRFADVPWFWYNADEEETSLAPNTKLIHYTRHDEIRLSGFLKGCDSPPLLMSSREKGRLLVMGLITSSRVVASAFPEEHEIAKTCPWEDLEEHSEVFRYCKIDSNNTQITKDNVEEVEMATSMAETYSVSKIPKDLHNDLLIPEFQRYFVWNKKRESLLIDSILRGYTIPPIWVWRHENEDGELVEEVIDGQQRLTCLHRFLKNEFPYVPPKNDPLLIPDPAVDSLGIRYFNKVPAGAEALTLESNFRKRINNTQLSKIVIKTENRRFVRSIFRRLNQTHSTLTAQEVRNATYEGEFKKAIYDKITDIRENSKLSDLNWLSKNRRVFTKPDRDRMADHKLLSEIYVALHKGGPQDRAKGVELAYQSWDKEFPKLARKETEERFDEIVKILKTGLGSESETGFTKNVSEFYSVVVAINELFENPKYKNVKPDSKANSKRICDALIDFRHKLAKYVDGLKEGKIPEGTNRIMETYRDSINKEIHIKEVRNRRHYILLAVMEPALIELDKDRLFSNLQKEFIWNDDPDHICKLCSEPVEEYSDYEPDHIIPHSKKGATCISNGQISHSSCNRKKNDLDDEYEFKSYKPLVTPNISQLFISEEMIEDSGED